jgi:hypothetical protein
MPEWQATTVGATAATPEPVELPGKPAAFAGDDAVRYVAELADPRSPAEDVAVLHLQGCYAHTEVELAGSVLGDPPTPRSHDVYFAPLRIPFYPAESCRIAVTCRSPTDRFGGLHDTDRVPEPDRVPAPWWAADLETHPLPFLDSLDVRPAVTDDGAVLHVSTTVVAADRREDRITYSLRPAGETATRGTMERATVETDGPGKTTVEHEIEVLDPALWWPRERGKQHRYTLKASLGESERTVTTGIRDVERDGETLRVNGEPITVRGVNLTTADVADVERALDCNANLVRGHAHVLPPAVYAACDEAGLLVWQDLPLTGPGGFDVDRGRELGAALGRVYGRHPSLAVTTVHDEPTDAFAAGLGSGPLDSLRRRWRAWRTEYDTGPAVRVAEALPAEIPCFPVVGDPGTGSEARRLFPGWDYGEAGDASALVERGPTAVVAEFGAGSLGSGDPSEAADFDRAKHDRHVAGDRDASQAYQARVIGTVASALRRGGVGGIVYSLRDTDAAGLGVYTADGEPKPAQATLAGAFEPLQAFLSEDGRVVVRNELPASVEAELAWEVGDASGTASISVAAGDRWDGDPLPPASDDPTATLEVRTDAGTVTRTVERG